MESPRPILEVPEESLNQQSYATQRSVNVVSKTSSGHSLTVPWPPLDPLGSQGHHQYRHLPLSLRRNLSAFSVVLVSVTPNQTDGLPRVRVDSNPHLQRLAPYTSPQSTAMNEYSRGLGSKLSFSSENLSHPLLNTRLRDWL